MTKEIRKTTVALVDDHPVFRKGLRMLLEDEPDFDVIGEAADGVQALELINELQPEIAVLDISMPGLNGIEVAERISASCPETRIVALSIHSEKRFVEDMLMAGAHGYILKQSVPEDLVNGIRSVMNGDSYLSPSITSVVLSGLKTGKFGKQESESEAPQIIATKLYPPKIPDNHVERVEIFKKLEKGSRLPLTLIIAPAGYGKTTCVSNWLQKQSTAYGWISLDETDNDLRRFLHYFLHVVQSLFPGSLAESELLVDTGELPSIHTLAATMLSDIEHIGKNFIVVLDDIHLVGGKQVYDFLSEILRHPPHNFHMIILGRRDPLLPIPKLRGNRMIAELRIGELRFNLDETRQYLQLMLGDAATEDLGELLHQKIEGWVAGLRLAVMASDQAGDLKQRLERLKGDSEFIQEYLINEVLENQAPAVRADLMKISILDRFCGPLCDVIARTLDHDSDREFSGWDFVKELKRANLFIVSLDSDNVWYRFHHLFQNLLQSQLQRSYGSELIDELQIVASNWFVSNGFIEDGIKHAIAGHDLDQAEQIVQQYRHKELARDRWQVVDQWLSMFPEEMILGRPILLLANGWVCFVRYRLQELAALIERLELIIGEVPLEGSLLGEYKFLQGLLSYWSGNSEACLLFMAEARDSLEDSSHQLQGLIETYGALARQMQGNSLIAIEQLQARILEVANTAVINRSRLNAALSFVHFLEGKLYPADESAERLMLLSTQNGLAYLESWAHYMRGNASLQLFDLEKAAYHFSALTDRLDFMHARIAVDALSGLALTRFFQQHQQEAYRISEVLSEFTLQNQDQQLKTVSDSLEARLLVMDKNEVDLENYLQRAESKTGYSAMFLLMELPEITLIRVLISLGSSSELERATELLAGVKKRLVAEHNSYHLVDILVLETMLMLRTEGADEALGQLEKALEQAAQGGWVRPFIESGQPVLELLARLEPATVKMNRHKQAIQQSSLAEQGAVAVADALSPAVLDDPLTNREFEILILLAQRMRNKEIGEKLFISSETVKSHIKRLFSKLDAVNRRDVVSKAIDAGLLKKK